ncbi:hypothetical protein GR183_21175 [Stappia sp. GBMRC 2046]|uniref:Pectate lyase n=1 Tax=Stappia sediminis TaxID=2692190 RepID=A0A7X3SA12_9HYPH|nr:hypothetical protein [Stappia sediminis]MXN67427.1 hypothetical protein [Stappia sediminis]
MASNLKLFATTLLALGALGFPSGNANSGTSNAAFPGAVGFGRHAVGWRGGEIVQVTNLRDSGPGSLRACAQHEGKPRVCVFTIGGTINVDKSILVASNTYIAGQTAPGQGVQIRIGKAQGTPLLILKSQDVLVRYIKLRPGPSPLPSTSVDGVMIGSSNDIYLDHLSVEFATDENVSVTTKYRPTVDITIANSIVGWGLDRANHKKGKHSKGALLCTKDGKNAKCGRLSLVGNLFAHNRDRNPDIASTPSGPIEIVNNVFYNPTSQFGEFYNHYGETVVNYVGNIALPGPSTRSSRRPNAFDAYPKNPDYRISIFAEDNINLDRQRGGGCNYDQRLPVVGDRTQPFLIDAPVFPLTVKPEPASETLENVLSNVGARTGPARKLDALDQKLIDEVRNCHGSRVDSPAEAGGWPELPTIEASADGDKDGMPDDWERTIPGLDPEDPGDAWSDRDGDGWSNIEEYLSYLAGDFKNSSK